MYFVCYAVILCLWSVCFSFCFWSGNDSILLISWDMLTVGFCVIPAHWGEWLPGSIRQSVRPLDAVPPLILVSLHTLERQPHSVVKKLRKRVTGAVSRQHGDADCNNNSMMSLESESIALIKKGSNSIPILIVFNEAHLSKFIFLASILILSYKDFLPRRVLRVYI